MLTSCIGLKSSALLCSTGSRNVRQGKAKETSHTLGSEDDTNNIESRDSQIWKEAAFPQYLQESIESSNFCDLWEEAKTRHSTLQGQEKHVKDTTLWKSIRREAEKDANDEPLLSSFLYASILSHDSFERSLAFILANRLSNTTLLPTELFELFHNVLSRDNVIRDYAQADLCAMRERVRGFELAACPLDLFAAFFSQTVSLWKTAFRIRHVEATLKPCFTLKDSMLFKFKGSHILCGMRAERSWPWPCKADLQRFLLSIFILPLKSVKVCF